MFQSLALATQISITYFILLPDFLNSTLTIGQLVLFNQAVKSLPSGQGQSSEALPNEQLLR